MGKELVAASSDSYAWRRFTRPLETHYKHLLSRCKTLCLGDGVVAVTHLRRRLKRSKLMALGALRPVKNSGFERFGVIHECDREVYHYSRLVSCWQLFEEQDLVSLLAGVGMEVYIYFV